MALMVLLECGCGERMAVPEGLLRDGYVAHCKHRMTRVDTMVVSDTSKTSKPLRAWLNSRRPGL